MANVEKGHSLVSVVNQVGYDGIEVKEGMNYLNEIQMEGLVSFIPAA